MKKRTRVIGERIAIDSHSCLEFFEERGRRYDPQLPLVSVLYQDRNPELALARDRAEKSRVIPLLHLDGTQKILDIGCGIGRWADAILDDVACYAGVDASHLLCERARQRITNSKAQFVESPAERILESPIALQRYDRFIVSGIFLYLNDDQLIECLDGIAELSASSALIYIREPLGVSQRLTLVDHWSEELDQRYSAIYRSLAEMNALVRDAFTPHGFDVPAFEPLFGDEALENRVDTRQHFAILSRI